MIIKVLALSISMAIMGAGVGVLAFFLVDAEQNAHSLGVMLRPTPKRAAQEQQTSARQKLRPPVQPGSQIPPQMSNGAAQAAVTTAPLKTDGKATQVDVALGPWSIVVEQAESLCKGKRLSKHGRCAGFAQSSGDCAVGEGCTRVTPRTRADSHQRMEPNWARPMGLGGKTF